MIIHSYPPSPPSKISFFLLSSMLYGPHSNLTISICYIFTASWPLIIVGRHGKISFDFGDSGPDLWNIMSCLLIHCSTPSVLFVRPFASSHFHSPPGTSFSYLPAFFLKALINPLVLASCPLLSPLCSSSERIFFARDFPSSTPHWSKLLMFHTAPSVNVTCS